MSGELLLAIGDVARFFGDGIAWAQRLSTAELAEWRLVMLKLREHDHGR